MPALAVVSAAAGALAGPGATGIEALDAMFRAGLCAGTVLLVGAPGTRDRRRRRLSRWLVAVASALALAGAGPDSVWLAGAGFGVAAGAIAARFGVPVLMALSAGLASQAALRLGSPSTELGTAMLAAAVFALLLGAGGLRLRTSRRRRTVRVGAVAVVVGGLASLLGLLAVVQARPSMEKGIRAARTGMDQASAGDVESSSRSLEAAGRSFGTAHRQLDAWWARPALAVPVVARQSRAVRAMAASGVTLSQAGARAAGVVDLPQVRVDRGLVPLERVAALEAPAREAHSQLARSEARLGRARSPWLLPPVSSRLRDLSERVEQARSTAKVAMVGSKVAPALLGANGPRRYFLAVLTPSELRGSGGLIGNFGEVGVDRGRLRLDRIGRIGELISAGKPASRQLVGAPPDYVDRYARFEVARLLQDLTLSPDFPSVARAIAGLYPQAGGRPVDGVIAIDPIGLAGLLEALGPVQVPNWPVPITGDNAAQILLFDQYVRFQGDERVDFLGRVTEAVWQRLTAATPSVVQLGRALGPEVAQKHVQLASTRPDEQRAFLDLGAAGAMVPISGDFLGVVTQNAANNKIDWFLRRSVTYEARLDPGSATIRSTARIVLRNQAPARGLPPYVIGSAQPRPPPPGTNRLQLSVYTPWTLTGAKVDGQPLAMGPERELGRQVYSAFLNIPPGGSLTVELELEGELDSRDGYRLDLHRQPFLAPDSVTTSVRVADGWRLDGKGTQQLELSSDRAWTVPLRRSL